MNGKARPPSYSSLIIPHSSFSSESRALEDLPQRGRAPRLRDEVFDDAVADLAQHRADRDAARQTHEEALRVRARYLAQERRAADLRHDLVADDQVEGIFRERAPRLAERRHSPHLVLRRERLAEHAEARRLVVEIKYRKPLSVSHVVNPRRAPPRATRGKTCTAGGPRRRRFTVSPRRVARAVQRPPTGVAVSLARSAPRGDAGGRSARHAARFASPRRRLGSRPEGSEEIRLTKKWARREERKIVG